MYRCSPMKKNANHRRITMTPACSTDGVLDSTKRKSVVGQSHRKMNNHITKTRGWLSEHLLAQGLFFSHEYLFLWASLFKFVLYISCPAAPS